MILLVTYDLKQSAASYGDLFDEMKARESWWHYLSSTWLIATHESPKELSSALRQHIFDGDRLLVSELGGYAGWLPRKAWSWIEKHS